MTPTEASSACGLLANISFARERVDIQCDALSSSASRSRLLGSAW